LQTHYLGVVENSYNTVWKIYSGQ